MRMDLTLNGERLLSLFLTRTDDGWAHFVRPNEDFEPYELQEHVAEHFERELPSIIGLTEVDETLAVVMTGAMTSSEEFDLLDGPREVRFLMVEDEA